MRFDKPATFPMQSLQGRLGLWSLGMLLIGVLSLEGCLRTAAAPPSQSAPVMAPSKSCVGSPSNSEETLPQVGADNFVTDAEFPYWEYRTFRSGEPALSACHSSHVTLQDPVADDFQKAASLVELTHLIVQLSDTPADRDLSRISVLTRLRVLEVQTGTSASLPNSVLKTIASLPQLLSFTCSHLDDDAVRTIVGSTMLTQLRLSFSKITDKSLDFIQRAGRIEVLNISNIEEISLGALAKFISASPWLKRLEICFARVDDAVLRAIADSRITALILRGSTLEGAKIGVLRRSKIERIDVRGCRLTDTDFKDFLGVAMLRSLACDGVGLDDDTIDLLTLHQDVLEELDIRGCYFEASRKWAWLSQCPSLKVLRIGGLRQYWPTGRVPSSLIRALESCRGLSVLEIQESEHVSQETWDGIMKMDRLVQLTIRGVAGPIDVEPEVLAGMLQLAYLDLYGSVVDATDVLKACETMAAVRKLTVTKTKGVSREQVDKLRALRPEIDISD